MLFGHGADGGIKILRTYSGFYAFKKLVQGDIFITNSENGDTRKITATEEKRLKKMDRIREGSLEEVFSE